MRTNSIASVGRPRFSLVSGNIALIKTEISYHLCGQRPLFLSFRSLDATLIDSNVVHSKDFRFKNQFSLLPLPR